MLHLDPSLHLQHYFDAPICATSWKPTSFDSDYMKYGLLWRCYDMAHQDMDIRALAESGCSEDTKVGNC